MNEEEKNAYTDEYAEDLISTLSEEELKKIRGGNKISKFFKQKKKKKQLEEMEEFDAMLDNIKNFNVEELIPDKYKQYMKKGE